MRGVCGLIALLALPATATLARRRTALADLDRAVPARGAERATDQVEEVSR